MGLMHHMLFHRRRGRVRKATPIALAVWLVMCVGGIIWLGVESQSAEVVIGAVVAVIFVFVKILVSS